MMVYSRDMYKMLCEYRKKVVNSEQVVEWVTDGPRKVTEVLGPLDVAVHQDIEKRKKNNRSPSTWLRQDLGNNVI